MMQQLRNPKNVKMISLFVAAIFVLSCFAVTLQQGAFTSIASAAASESAIGVVNYQMLLAQSPDIAGVQDAMKQEVAAQQKNFDEKSKDMNDTEKQRYYQQLQEVIANKEFKVGVDAPAFSIEGMDGEEIELKNYAGKYVLLDFWASWCKPCCEEMPSLKKLYRDYRAKGLEIVGISIDEDKKAWQQKVGDLGMNWIQLRDASREAVKKYVIGPIPHTVLIDPSGKIIAKDLRGQELENKIIECLK